MYENAIPLVYESGPLRIRYLKGESADLIVSFSGVGKQRSVEPPPEFPGIASADRQNHVLFVSDMSRSWLNGDGMAGQILRCIQATADHVKAARVIALGNSMGGTMALHLSRYFGFEKVIAFTPQYSVHPDDVPEEDRWHYFRKRIRTFHFPRVEALRPEATKYFIFHGDENRELAHALRFPRKPGISHFILPGADHRLASELRSSGVLGPLIENILAGKTRRFRRQIANLGGVSIAQYRPDADALQQPDFAIAS
ncbi:hypothetical protein [uncultured Marivita sp.]|jgi:hypothetical protein|uniref:hypothetical protein n=2 Tax=Marivita TaxID=659428 RepID=UPI000D7A5F95|nr:hypothetical protein [uncultured Marivita sp.]MCR9108335.1 hypothetical protein [Paracoccaceae bacterium]PWL36292.1 MAG: hypothetical protein DCO97_04835 [Marivita sp. XM-24bin2]